MQTQTIILWVIAVVVIGGGALLLVQRNTADKIMTDEIASEKTLEDGTVVKADGTKVKPDGTMVKPDGTMIKPDGTMVKPDGTMVKPDGTMEKDEGAMMQKGSYEPYAPEKLALAESGKVVLYFHADWCPICRGIESEIRANPSGIPEGVHILKIDYDTATDLKRKYGVTYQHTFVQVDSKGNLIAKWGDATTLAQVISKIK